MSAISDAVISISAFGVAAQQLGVTMEQLATAMRNFNASALTLSDDRVITDEQVEENAKLDAPFAFRKIRL